MNQNSEKHILWSPSVKNAASINNVHLFCLAEICDWLIGQNVREVTPRSRREWLKYLLCRQHSAAVCSVCRLSSEIYRGAATHFAKYYTVTVTTSMRPFYFSEQCQLQMCYLFASIISSCLNILCCQDLRHTAMMICWSYKCELAKRDKTFLWNFLI